MKPIPPLYTADLFLPLHQELLALLRGLSAEDWDRPTIAAQWRVRDVVAHLLDVDLRKLSISRDGYRPAPSQPINSYQDLVAFLNRLNAEWVGAARRLSPQVLIELHAFAGPLVAEHVLTLPPHEPSAFPVSWAGESESENWFDIGREYTERWHHQMQIRDAVGARLLLDRRWLFPLLGLSLRALPYAYRDVDAPRGTAITIQITGEAGDAWSLIRDDDGWKLNRGAAADAAVVVTLDPDTAWRLFYNGLTASKARQSVRTEGDASLAEPLFTVRSVMV